MALTIEEAAQKIHHAGLRMTRQRETLLRLVLAHNGPFSVKMLYERALDVEPSIHLATVHRNLAEFVAVGLVDELPGDENRIYALHAENESGAHVYCIDCRLVVPLAGMALAESEAHEALVRALSQQGFDASTMRLMLTVHCKAQQAQLNGADCSNQARSR